MPCLSWRGRTAQRRDGQLYDLLSMWHQCAALFHGKRIPHVFQVFSSLSITLFLKSLFQQGYLWHFWFFGSLILIYLVMPLLYWLLHDHTLALLLLCMLLALCSICLCLLSMHRGLQYTAVCSPDAPPLDMAVLFPLWRPLCSQGGEKFPASVHPYASVASLDPSAAPCHPQ